MDNTREIFDIEMILANYTVMFNSNEYSVNAYSELQKISPLFPHIDDADFWNKLNLAFMEYCNMDIQALEEYLTKGVRGEPLRRTHIFEFIRGKRVQ